MALEGDDTPMYHQVSGMDSQEPAREAGPVEVGIRRLYDELEFLARNVTALHDRLTPVLTRNETTDDSATSVDDGGLPFKESESRQSKFADLLDQRIDAVRQIRSVVNNALDRLEI